MKNSEQVDHPSHYNQGRIEVIDFIDDQDLNFSLGNAVKYICRSGHKGSKLQDLKKAIWYLEHEVKSIEGKKKSLKQQLIEDWSCD